MSQLDALEALLHRIDGRGYKAYKDIAGSWEADGFTLCIDHVQGDPFADPSRLRVLLPPARTAFPDWALSSEPRRTAAADFLNRCFADCLDELGSHRGSGRSGELRILRPGQEVLPRTSLTVDAEGRVEARFRAGLPASGRRVLGRQAAELLCHDVAQAVEDALVSGALDLDALRRHVETVEDARALRGQLGQHGLVAFVADGAVLPRRSGVDDRPLSGSGMVPFQAPEALRVTLEAPNAGAVTGLGVPQGVTLVVGGGYHGKSTLLRAVEVGVWDHVPGDGREQVVAVEGCVKVRAEDGRSVAGTDISAFLSRLPGGEDTSRFVTPNASGSTSQAAAIAEALEAGAGCLLVDEDTSATNFMIRDARMQRLIHQDDEPITPFIDRVRQLAGEQQVSTIIVVGGAGDYFDVADTVIAMRGFRPRDVTEEARTVARELPTDRRTEAGAWPALRRRIPRRGYLPKDPRGRGTKIRVRDRDRVQLGREDLDLGAVEQIVDRAQTRALAAALVSMDGRAVDGRRDVAGALQALMEEIDRGGLDALQSRPTGDLARFRIHDLAAALARLRSLKTQ